MPTCNKKHVYKHYFPLVFFTDEERQFATMSPVFAKASKQAEYAFNRKHFTGNFPFIHLVLPDGFSILKQITAVTIFYINAEIA